MFIPTENEVKMPKKGSVATYLDILTDKLAKRERVRVYTADIERPIKQGGLGWRVTHTDQYVRPGDTSFDWQGTGLVAIVDGSKIAEKLEEEAQSRGYGIVFYCSRGRIYAAKHYPE